jgi:tripartite-type tricarboxylate transporter receptor subunit TctC
MIDLVAGQIDIMIDQTSNSIAQVHAGTIRSYAITDEKRVESLPNVPTVDEAGLKGFHMTLWSGLWLPKGTPKDIVMKINAAAVAAMENPAVRKKFLDLGLEVPAHDRLTPEALGAFQKAEIVKWWPMLKAANVKAE